MTSVVLARTPEPPYYAVIFSSRVSGHDPDGYVAASETMFALAQQQPGFLGIETVRDADGRGITVCYWDSEASIAAWREQADHAAVQERGRHLWYEAYDVRVARVERAYHWQDDTIR